MGQDKEQKTPTEIPGVTEEAEQATFHKILAVADANLEKIKGDVQSLAGELNELKEVYDASDKEGLAQWFNTDARFKQVREDLLRAERGRKKPYFGRIDFMDTTLLKKECYYIGRSVIAEDAAHPMVIDWRAPIASVYYEKALGKCNYTVKGEGSFEIDLSRKRTYEIEEDELKDFYDTDVVANDELLTKYLARNKRAVLSDIIATIQKEQNEIIRKNPKHNIIVQGSAGSGKTTVAMHRISYILYNYDREFQPKDFYIIGSNKILLNYITGILPDLDVYGIAQMTMEQLFTRLLYEDWDPEKYTIKKQNKRDKVTALKGTFQWFHDLEAFCDRYEKKYIPRQNIILEKTKEVLMNRSAIEFQLNRFRKLSLSDKLEKLTERLMTEVDKALCGKDYSFSGEEKKALIRKYQNYFMRLAWKGSIYELYDTFIQEQNEKGHSIAAPETELDLYDLAALAYLYKRIKETEVIQEASHVVIDEAQDFGMMVYGSLKYCLSKCTYTIMGDVSQNIYFDYGLTDWEELRSLMLPERFDYFGLLRKSYRNTVEISDFATRILQHGNFPVYPVEPILRHGEAVRVTECEAEPELFTEVVNTALKWQAQGYETVAVICSDDAEAAYVSKNLKKKAKSKLQIQDFDAQTETFGTGVMVLPIEYAKGLEFDAVLLFNADRENYPLEDGFAKLLYVAATRALHELVVLYHGQLTELIGAPVPEERLQKNLVTEVKQEEPVKLEEDTRTKREIEVERAREGHWEMEQRERYGPKRIVAVKPKAEEKPAGVKPKGTYNRTFIGSSVGNTVVGVKAAGLAIAKQRRMENDNDVAKKNAPTSEFGTLPESTSLRPMGHPILNYGIKWTTANKQYVEMTTACGVLRITPIAADCVRVNFAKQQIERLAALPEELKAGKPFKWNCRETRDRIELATERMQVCVDKKTGAVAFYTPGQRLLLAENSRVPRQLGMFPKNQTWTYFDWGKKEVLKARGVTDMHWTELGNTAKFISLGEKSDRPACILSNMGYQLLVAPKRKTMCCTIPTYGPYLSTEGQAQIDYFFRIGI